MQLDTFRSQFFEEESVAQITSFLKSKDDVSLRNVSGSLYALTAFAVIEKIQGFHLFIQPDKEQALYLLNDLENIIQQQRGTTILFYPASYRRPYQIMEADPTSVLQRTEVINALEKQRKKVIIVTYPEAIVEKVIDRSSLKKQSIVLNKEEETKKLFNFCDMDWNEKIFDFYKNVKTIRTVSVNQVKKPIYTSSIDSSSNYTKFFQHLNRLED